MTDASDDLIYARDLDEFTDSRRDHARAVDDGRERRVSLGVYLPEPAWAASTDAERYLLRVRSIATTRKSDPVFSFWSAAVVHGLPILGPWPSDVHVTVGRAGGGRSSGQLVRHATPLRPHDVTRVEGIRLTSVARTVVDLASTRDSASAIVLADAALHVDRLSGVAPSTTRDALDDVYRWRTPFAGSRRARKVLASAVESSDSPLESVSRLNMGRSGLPRPVLQQRFDDYRGLIGFSELFWPAYRLVGEADGRAKYSDPRYRKERTLEQVLLDEKVRGDRLRAIGLDITRWGWDIGANAEGVAPPLMVAKPGRALRSDSPKPSTTGTASAAESRGNTRQNPTRRARHARVARG